MAGRMLQGLLGAGTGVVETAHEPSCLVEELLRLRWKKIRGGRGGGRAGKDASVEGGSSKTRGNDASIARWGRRHRATDASAGLGQDMEWLAGTTAATNRGEVC